MPGPGIFDTRILEIQLGKLYDTSLVKQINNWLFQILVEHYNLRHIDRDVKRAIGSSITRGLCTGY